MIRKNVKQTVAILRVLMPGYNPNMRHVSSGLQAGRRRPDAIGLDEPTARSVLKARSSVQSGGSRNADGGRSCRF